MIELEEIVAVLESLEETIIAKLIDRAQFRANPVVYEPGQSGYRGAGDASLFELRLRQHETMDAKFGRFLVPEERPFTPRLPPACRAVMLSDDFLAVDELDSISVTGAILDAYLDFLPKFCLPGDDKQYGSSVEHDVYALQAISRRIHFGAFYVAESKYRSSPGTFADVVRKRDTRALEELLTRPEVEESVLRRVAEKVKNTQEKVDRRLRTVVDSDVLRCFYRDHIIPLTKRGEVLYLLHRRLPAQ